MAQENRQFTRMPLKIPFRLHLPDGTLYEYDQFEDISLGGCQVYSKKGFEMYSDCEIEILAEHMRRENGAKIRVQAKIMRIGYDYTGIKFVRIAPDSISHLQNLLKDNAPDPEKVKQEIIGHIGII